MIDKAFPRRDSGGFTLIEVMVAAMLFAIVMLYGLSFFVYGSKPMVRAGEYNFALGLAKNEVEYVKTIQYSVLSAAAPANAYHSSSGELHNGLAYVPATSISRVFSGNKVGEYFEEYIVVTATVSWNARDRGNQNVVLTTLVSPPPDFYLNDYVRPH